MFEAIASPAGFIALIAFFCLGCLAALILNKQDKYANIVSNAFSFLGAAWGLIFSASMLISGQDITLKVTAPTFDFFSISLHIDKLAAFFILVISLIAAFCSIYAIGYVREYYKRYNIGVLGFLYNLFIIGMLLVVTASNGMWFLLAWEVMSLASYFLVVYDRQNAQNVKAGYIYLAMTHVGAACILLAFALLFAYTGSFDFDVISASISGIPPLSLVAVFGLFFVGLGVKAGVIPFHIWLPSAHPAAPSHVSAMMSGVMIKTGIYMMIRLFLDILQPIPLWWGVVILIVGAVSALMGVLYALAAHDIKRLLAYHSIENIGIILLGLGAAMIFAAQNQPVLELLALCAALFHTLNHATFKSLLFLSAGSIIQATHTRNIEKYGGLLKLMPLTGLAFLAGSMAISALPPFNGFFSEWLTYQSLLGGLASGGDIRWVFLLAGIALAITGGLALACFVKAFGITFLARARSNKVKKAKESSVFMTISMSCLAALCLLIGVFSGPIMAVIQNVGSQLVQDGNNVATSAYKITTVVLGQPSTVSGVAIFALVAIAIVGSWFIVRYVINRKQKVRIAPTWDCGTQLNGRMEITATSFARSILLIFGQLVRPKLEKRDDYSVQNKYALQMRDVAMSTCDFFQTYVYKPIYCGLMLLSGYVKRIQNGNLNAYVLYIFGALLLTLIIGVL